MTFKFFVFPFFPVLIGTRVCSLCWRLIGWECTLTSRIIVLSSPLLLVMPQLFRDWGSLYSSRSSVFKFTSQPESLASVTKMPAPPNYVFTIFSFVAFFLCLVKFPMQFNGRFQLEGQGFQAHAKHYNYSAWNIDTHLFLAWVGPECLILGINSIIWNHNTVNWAPVWCDISQFFFICFKQWRFSPLLGHVIAARFNIGISIAVPAAILCINRRLYMLVSPISIIPSKADKNRELIIDLAIGIGLPIIVMVLCLSSYLSLYLLGSSIVSDSSIFPAFLTQTSRFMIVEDYGCYIPIISSWVTLVIMIIPPILVKLITGV